MKFDVFELLPGGLAHQGREGTLDRLLETQGSVAGGEFQVRLAAGEDFRSLCLGVGDDLLGLLVGLVDGVLGLLLGLVAEGLGLLLARLHALCLELGDEGFDGLCHVLAPCFCRKEKTQLTS